MSVNGSVSSSPSEVLVLPVRNVQVRLRVTILLRETEVDDIDLVSSLANSHQEVVGLDVSMDEVSRVNVLDPGDELIGEEQDGLQAELSVAEIEKVLQGWAAAKVDEH